MVNVWLWKKVSEFEWSNHQYVTLWITSNFSKWKISCFGPPQSVSSRKMIGNVVTLFFIKLRNVGAMKLTHYSLELKGYSCGLQLCTKLAALWKVWLCLWFLFFFSFWFQYTPWYEVAYHCPNSSKEIQMGCLWSCFIMLNTLLLSYSTCISNAINMLYTVNLFKLSCKLSF